MDKVLSDFRKTIKYFNKKNQENGYKVKYYILNKSDSNALWQVMVTCIPDKVTKDKFILLDPSLDIQDEISYFIDGIITSFYKWFEIKYCGGKFYMEEYKALSDIFQLSVELAKYISLCNIWELSGL